MKKGGYAENKYGNVSKEEKQKLKDWKKNKICSISQEELQYQKEQITEQIKEILDNWKLKEFEH